MPQRVFFRFDFDRDLQTARQVRDAWELHGKGATLPLYDAVEFEDATQRAGGINNWIDDQPSGMLCCCGVGWVRDVQETVDTLSD